MWTCACCVLGAGLLPSSTLYAQSGATVGRVRGVDKAGEPVVSATIVTSSPALVGEQVVITDDTRQYFTQKMRCGVRHSPRGTRGARAERWSGSER